MFLATLCRNRLGIFDALGAQLAVIYHNSTGATESCRGELGSPHHDGNPEVLTLRRDPGGDGASIVPLIEATGE